MSLLTLVASILFVISYYYSSYWDNVATHRIVTIISKNGYLLDYSSENIAFATVNVNKAVTVQRNTTELDNSDIQKVSLSLIKLGKKQWKWKSYIYALTERSDGTWQVVFSDLNSYPTPVDQILLTVSFTIFGFLLLGFVSLYLSRYITKPALDAISREKQFVSDASHELKTPLTAIRSNAQVLQRQIAPNRYLDYILSETKRMDDLIQNLLGLAKLDNNPSFKGFDKINLSTICDEMVLTYESLAYEEGKLIASDISEDINIEGQEVQLRQLVTILLDNAIKHSLNSGSIQISLKQFKKEAVLKISNPSQSYSPDIMTNLFERFYQSEKSRQDTSSFGLGLAIAKAIVDRHHGSIKAWQSNGKLYFEVRFGITKRSKP